jgi:hypothetical protein
MRQRPTSPLARIMHETPWRDRGDGRAIRSLLACPTCPELVTGKPLQQRCSSQSLQLGEKEGHIRGRSRWLVHNGG